MSNHKNVVIYENLQGMLFMGHPAGSRSLGSFLTLPPCTRVGCFHNGSTGKPTSHLSAVVNKSYNVIMEQLIINGKW